MAESNKRELVYSSGYRKSEPYCEEFISEPLGKFSAAKSISSFFRGFLAPLACPTHDRIITTFNYSTKLEFEFELEGGLLGALTWLYAPVPPLALTHDERFLALWLFPLITNGLSYAYEKIRKR